MTVQDWLASRTPPPPPSLGDRVRLALGDDVRADVAVTTDVCLRAAVRELRDILDARKFGRDGALDLLVVDALTTYAYEFAAAAGDELPRLAAEGVQRFGDIAAKHG